MKEKQKLHKIFLNIIDLEKKINIFVAVDEDVKKLLGKIMRVKFNKNFAIKKGMIMRKQIVPLLKNELDNYL